MPPIYWIVDMSSIVWLLYCKLIIEGFPPTSPLFLLPTIKPTNWPCVTVNNCTNKTSRSFNTREQCYAFVPTWKCSVYYSKTAQGLKLKQMLWLQSFGTPTRKQINNPCFLPSRNVYFLQMCVIWCGFQWNSLFFFLFLLSWAFCQEGGRRSPRWITLTRLRLVRSRTQTHSANCRLALRTPDRKPQAGWLWLRWSEKAERSTKTNSNTKTLWSTHKFTSTAQDKQKHRLPHLGLKSCLLSSNKCFTQTSASEMVENPKWRPWLRFQRDMTIQHCNYMCCNAPLIMMVQRHIELL